MIILDTNIISEFLSKAPNSHVLQWSKATSMTDVYLCSPVVSELEYGAHRYLQRNQSRRYLEKLETLLSGPYKNRILAFELVHARIAGSMRAFRASTGRPVLPMDMAIAAIAKSHNATLATRNIRDFEGLDLKLINPFEA